ncbi:MAG: hypothetical protein V1820_01180 [archaeon]
MILLALLLWQVAKGVGGLSGGNDQLRMTTSLSQIREGVVSVCTNGKTPYTIPGGVGQPQLSLKEEQSVYVISCETVERLEKIPQKVWSLIHFRYDVKQKDVGDYDGWENVLLDCSRIPADKKNRRVHVLNFAYRYSTIAIGGGHTAPTGRVYEVSDLAADCALHDFIPYSSAGVGEFYGGTTQAIEIALSDNREVYVSGGTEEAG